MLIRVIKRTNLKMLYLLSDFPEGGVEVLVNVKEKNPACICILRHFGKVLFHV